MDVQFSKECLLRLSEFLANQFTHSQITELFRQNGFSNLEIDSGLNKAKRIYNIFCHSINRNHSSFTQIFNFLFTLIKPVRFETVLSYEDFLYSINQILLLEGLELKIENGKKKILRTKQLSISEANKRANELRSFITERQLHPILMKYCQEQYLQENYFHAVLEASKSIFSTIKLKTHIDLDGHKLIDKAFSVKDPYIIINTLDSESKRNEQVGFIFFLKGITTMFRNPTAHEPKINSELSREDAIDIFTMISYAHRVIESSVLVRSD